MNIPYLDLKPQYKALEKQLEARVLEVLKSGQYILGKEAELCEKQMAQFTEAPYCLTAASGTDALLMALLAADVGPGDEVIVPAFTFYATAEVVALIGAKPVFVDVDEQTYNIQPQAIEESISAQTKAIMPVSLYGQVADMDEINALAEAKGLVVIEDAAQRVGAIYNGKKSCNLSSLACTSFFPAKPLGCFGDGGAIFCQSEEMKVRLEQIRNHGQESRYYHTRLGINGRLDALQCAILSVKLERYPWEVEQRQKVATFYNDRFSQIESLSQPLIKEGRDSVYAQYTLRVKNRGAFQKSLSERGVPTSIHYPKGLHQQPAMKAYAPKKPLKVTETICEQVISLPLYADMPEEHMNYVADQVVEVSRL